MSLITVTESAAAQIKRLLDAEGKAGTHALRMKVVGGGCSGLQYQLSFDPNLKESDDQIVSYFTQAVEAIGQDTPFVVQDFPQASGVVMAPSAIRRIVEAQPSCVMLKAEDWPGQEWNEASGKAGPADHAVKRLLVRATIRQAAAEVVTNCQVDQGHADHDRPDWL